MVGVAYRVQREDYLATPVVYNPMYQEPLAMEHAAREMGSGYMDIFTKPSEILLIVNELMRISREKKK